MNEKRTANRVPVVLVAIAVAALGGLRRKRPGSATPNLRRR